jgi:non-homologous end joining protein Ku
VIDAKRKRKTIHAPKPEKEPEPVSDLMAALDETLERLRKGEDIRAEQDGASGNASRKSANRRRGSSGDGRRRTNQQRKRSKSAG